MLRVCQVVASINRDVGGPAVTVPRLSASLENHGVRCTLVTLDYCNLGPQAEANGYNLVSVTAGLTTRRMRGWSPELRARLNKEAQKMDLIHNHGLWMFPNLYARQAAVRAKIPLVVSPRGMLEQWSLGRSRAKKFAAWTLFEHANLASTAMFHATSEMEASSLRKVGFRQPIMIIPNGVDIPEQKTFPKRQVLEKEYPELAGRRWLVFLSRIHRKKGVSELLAGWREVERNFPQWQLILAGPDLDGYGANARTEAARYGISGRVTFTGMLAGTDKKSALANGDLFVLPTHSENFGIAIAEALAFGLPVITTKGTPWRELESHRCGWWIDLKHSVLVRCMEAALQLPKSELQKMGERGRALMIEKYSWSKVGAQMKQSYEWLLDRGDKPGFVVTSS